MENGYIELVPREIREAGWPKARLLSDDEQGRYQEFVNGFNSERAKRILNSELNLFKIIGLNQIGIRTASIPELYDVWDIDSDFLSGHYEDVPSIVLRSPGDSYENNNDLARNLAGRIGKVRKDDFKHSYVLQGLKLEESEASPYGLVIDPGEDFNHFEAPEFDHANNGKRFSRLDERGVPIFDDKGDRTLYTREDGLSRFVVDGVAGLGSGYRVLSNSDSDGRVVVVDAVGVAPKNLDHYIAELDAEKATQEEALEKRYEAAKATLLGEKI